MPIGILVKVGHVEEETLSEMHLHTLPGSRMNNEETILTVNINLYFIRNHTYIIMKRRDAFRILLDKFVRNIVSAPIQFCLNVEYLEARG